LEQLLSAEERKLSDPHNAGFFSSEEDVVLVLMDSQSVRTWPDKALLFWPIVPAGHEISSRLFADAEKAEFQDNDYPRAISLLRPLARSEDQTVQQAAKLRLARILRKAGRLNDALVIYQELAAHTTQFPVTVSRIPIDLIARRAGCALLAEMENRDQLQLEAENLYSDLKGRRWPIDRSTYLLYVDQVKEWLDPKPSPDLDSQVLADAVGWLWDNNQVQDRLNRSKAGRSTLRIQNRPIAVLWQRSGEELAAIVAGPIYQRTRWFDPLFKSPDFSSISVCLRDPEGTVMFGNDPPSGIPSTSRPAQVSGLPWEVSLINADLASDLSQFAQRRRLMLMGLGFLVLLVIAVSYLISRAVSRELAAARLQADFVSAVSHEFRTPLTSMRQFTDMLNEDDSLPVEKRRVYYAAQARATNRLSRLVESLLDFGRMEAGARPYRFDLLDAGQLVKTVVEEYREETGLESLRIECAIPEEGPSVNGDRDALAQALWNLIDNAVKYSVEDSKVHIEVITGARVDIMVRDLGFGIPAAEKSRILHKFVRGSNTRKLGIKGTGIGLAVVKHIIDAHKGELSIDSELGKGSTFTISLPAGG
jgi:signal transduction histidine kinase